jgi:uncharacterized protein (DUF58 family)
MANRYIERYEGREISLSLSTPLPSLSKFPNTKDIGYHPLFRGGISRFLWKLLTLTVTPAGRWFLIATFAFGVVGSISLEFQTYVLFCCATGIWLIAGICVYLVRPAMAIAARHADRVSAGSALDVELTVRSGRRGSAGLMVLPHHLPPEIDAVPEAGVALPPLGPGESAIVHLQLHCRQRGAYFLKAYRVETHSPLGILRSIRVSWQRRQLLVYPLFHPLRRFILPTGWRFHPGGVALASHVGDSLELLGNREYKEGDNIRNMDWQATARLNHPIVREYREEYFFRVGVVLDTHVPFDDDSGRPLLDRDARLMDFERAVSMCAAVSDYMARQDYIVDIFAAGPDLYHLTAGRSLAYLDQVLDILACVEASGEASFDRLEPEIAAHLDRITTVICIFTDWDAARMEFVRRLATSGAGVKAIVVRDTPPTIDPATAEKIVGIVPVISADEFDAGVEDL